MRTCSVFVFAGGGGARRCKSRWYAPGCRQEGRRQRQRHRQQHWPGSTLAGDSHPPTVPLRYCLPPLPSGEAVCGAHDDRRSNEGAGGTTGRRRGSDSGQAFGAAPPARVHLLARSPSRPLHGHLPCSPAAQRGAPLVKTRAPSTDSGRGARCARPSPPARRLHHPMGACRSRQVARVDTKREAAVQVPNLSLGATAVAPAAAVAVAAGSPSGPSSAMIQACLASEGACPKTRTSSRSQADGIWCRHPCERPTRAGHAGTGSAVVLERQAETAALASARHCAPSRTLLGLRLAVPAIKTGHQNSSTLL